MREIRCRWKSARRGYVQASTPDRSGAWKRRIRPPRTRLSDRGCRLVPEDECVFHHQTRPSRSSQGPGSRPGRQYSGRPTRTIMLGGVADEGTHALIRAKKNNGRGFLLLAKKLQATNGRFVLIMELSLIAVLRCRRVIQGSYR